MIKRLLRRFIARPDFPAIAPDSPFFALGDIHGRADLLRRFLDSNPAHQVVCVGDYVDRGDDSAEVLRMLQARPDIICLSGNHEEMMLEFLNYPEDAGSRWVRYGGLQTLASFGVAGITESASAEALVTARDQLKQAMGPELIAWMHALPTLWRSGNVAVVHAAASPARSMNDQRNRTLRWGHPDFEKVRRRDGIWVIHGHTIVDQAHATEGRIAIDTGAYATGRLTAALIEAGNITFQTIT